MICEICKGKGEIQGQAPGLMTRCPGCGGTGIVTQTNEKWFDSLSTNQKAKELQLVYISGRTDEFYDNPQKSVKDFVAWLKAEHKES